MRITIHFISQLATNRLKPFHRYDLSYLPFFQFPIIFRSSQQLVSIFTYKLHNKVCLSFMYSLIKAQNETKQATT